MGRPATLLEGISGYALSIGADSIEVSYQDGQDWAYANKSGTGISIAHYKSSSADARELRENLYAAAKKSVRMAAGGRVYILKVDITDSFGEDAFLVHILPAPKLDPSKPPKFTAKQGQYLAYIQNYSKLHRQAPAELDMQQYFQVSPPSVHEMIKTLERNGLIERTPGQARSIRVCVPAEHLPRLE